MNPLLLANIIGTSILVLFVLFVLHRYLRHRRCARSCECNAVRETQEQIQDSTQRLVKAAMSTPVALSRHADRVKSSIRKRNESIAARAAAGSGI